MGPNVKKPIWGTENEVLRLSLHHGLHSERGGIHIFRLVVRRTLSKTEGCVSNNLDLQLFTREFDLAPILMMEVKTSHAFHFDISPPGIQLTQKSVTLGGNFKGWEYFILHLSRASPVYILPLFIGWIVLCL